jgi:hypothetical protein
LAESRKLPERRTLLECQIRQNWCRPCKSPKEKAEWDARVKDLERRYREEENSEIHEMVHAANLTPDQLSELLRMFAADMAPKPETINAMNEEEMQNED